MNKIIDLIIKNKSRVIILSPHLDDAVFSCGGLMSTLKGKVKIEVVNIFTKTSKPYTLSAKRFIEQCGYKDVEELYIDRIKEDVKALSKLGIKPTNLNLDDALFRKIIHPNKLIKLLGKYLPEFLHVYPTYKFHISQGRVSNDDTLVISKVVGVLSKLKLDSTDFLFVPMGIGNHVDHLITKMIGQTLSGKLNVIYYADYPYLLKHNSSKSFTLNLSPNWMTKTRIIKMYKSQYSAVFSSKPKNVDEYYSIVPYEKFYLKVLKNLAMLIKTPKEYIFSFTYPNSKVYKVHLYKNNLHDVGRKIIQKVKRLVPGIKIHFYGSAALKIAGQKDIDLFAECDPNNFDIQIPKISKLFGTKFKVRPNFIEWNITKKDIDLEFLLIDPKSKMLEMQKKTFDALDKNPGNLIKYEIIKLFSDNMPYQKYQRLRLEFFNKILGL